jgi:glycosyltransferase involved in cell wall biosynthesis
VSKPKLTAIIPVAKMAGKLLHLEPLLNKCVFLGIEVVIVHDEQDLKTGDELLKIVKSVNSRMITLITKTVLSPGKARNLGLEIASGEWICFWDSDDNPFPEKFLEMVQKAGYSGNNFAVGKFQKKRMGKIQNYGVTDSDIGRMPGIWRFAFKNGPIRGIAFPDYRMGEDQVFLARVLIRLGDYYMFEEIVYEYVCDNEGQLTRNRKAILELEFAIRDMATLVEENEKNHGILLIFLSKQIITFFKCTTPKFEIELIKTVIAVFRKGGKGFLAIFLHESLASFKKLRLRRGSH